MNCWNKLRTLGSARLYIATTEPHHRDKVVLLVGITPPNKDVGTGGEGARSGGFALLSNTAPRALCPHEGFLSDHACLTTYRSSVMQKSALPTDGNLPSVGIYRDIFR